MENTITYQIEDFNGPLDLLLTLVAKNKMSIYDIEILTLIDQYLEVVHASGHNAMESASEFITMAARLVQIKSTLLLPRSEEGERMREELTGLLVEYSACKQVAGQLREMAQGVFLAVRQPAQIELDTLYTGQHLPPELVAAYTSLLGRGARRRAPQRERFDELVTAPVVSVAGRIIHVLRGLLTGKFAQLRQLFGHHASRGETVATFLAVLELIRGGRISIDDSETLHIQKGASQRKSIREQEATDGP